MNIVVLLRPVHHSAMPVNPGTASTIETLPGYQAVANPRDELALEAALTLKDDNPEEVYLSICAVGEKAATQVLQECLAYNINEAVLLKEPFWEPDGRIVGTHLAHFLEATPFDLVLMGNSDTDTGIGQTGPMLSAMSGVPYIDSVVAMNKCGPTQLEIHRQEKRLKERIHISLPAAIGILRGRPLRYHSLWGKLKSQQKTIRSFSSSLPAFHSAVERKKFTRSKPKTTAMAGGHGHVRSADRIRQAVGMLSSGPAQKGDGLIKGRPEDTARKAVDLIQMEKLLES